jgi:hypothetical protein
MFENGTDFENEVRRIARALWDAPMSDGASMEDGRERDGVFITDEMVHLLECTILRKKDKAEEDIKKLVELTRKYKTKYSMKGIKGWFVTLDEPTADQRSVANKHRDTIVIISYQQFKSQLIDASSYIDGRHSYPFGSMRNPLDEGSNKWDVKYVELDLVDDKGTIWGIKQIAKGLNEGKRFVTLGDYGAGKSTTMREIFLSLAKSYRKNETLKFPIMLNLRDHHGQSNPAEALERHARNIGLKSPNHLVRAWRSGYGILMLDGFDEIATAGWASQVKKLKDIRYRAMELIRKFIEETPNDTGIIISGRSHFFDNTNELKSSLGIREQFTILNLNDFTESQIEEYLKKHSWTNRNIPGWLPSRPLLLGYLLSKNFLDNLSEFSNPASGWNELLQRISDREARIEAGIDGETVRTILERLGSKARNTNDGLGRLLSTDIVDAFQQVCGYQPDDRGVVLLQRLPGLGLGAQRHDDGSRQFIDKDLADAVKAGDILRYIQDPFNFPIEDPGKWRISLGPLGREMVLNQFKFYHLKDSHLSTAISQAANKNDYYFLASDLLQVLQEGNLNYSLGNITISDVHLQDIGFDDESNDYSNITYKDCIFDRIDISPGIDSKKLPIFKSCMFASICGLISEADMPKEKFTDTCVYEEFESSTKTTNAILDTHQPIGVKVLLTVLKKLYMQSGSGRKNSALYRGLDQRSRSLVPQIIQLLKAENLITKAPTGDDTVWLPTRSAGIRVKQIILAPTTSTDPLISKASKLIEH